MPQTLDAQAMPEASHVAIQTFVEAVFKDATGDFQIDVNDQFLVTRRVVEAVAAASTSDPGISLVTLNNDGSLCEVVGVARKIASSNDPALSALAPSLILTSGERRAALWLLTTPATYHSETWSQVVGISRVLRGDADSVTDLIPFVGTGEWTVESGNFGTMTRYTIEDLEKAFPATINDARVHGVISPDLLTRTITIGYSDQGADTRPGRWKTLKDLQVGQLIAKLSKHEQGDKDGSCLLQGATIDGIRTAQAMERLDLVILDVDTGQDIDTIRRRIMELGLFAVLYTTHSYGKPSSEVLKDTFLKWNSKIEPTAESLTKYFREEKRYQPDVLVGAKLGETKHTSKGIMLVLHHQPMPKFRVVLLLSKPFVIAERGTSQKEAISDWHSAYRGVAQLLNAAYDRSCIDPSRLMFMPRHAKGAEFHVDVIAGNPLDIDSVERVSSGKGKDAASSIWEEAGAAMGAGKNGSKTYKVPGLMKFLAKYGATFEAEDFLRAVDPDGDRGKRPGGKPGSTWRCPNDDAHTDAGNELDQGFFCVNGSESDGGGATMFCSHDSCSQLDRADFIDLLCVEHEIDHASKLKEYVAETLENEVDEDEEEIDEAGEMKAALAQAPGIAGPSTTKLPKSYFVSQKTGRICFKAGGDSDIIELCSMFDMVARVRNERDSGYGKLIEFDSPSGGKKTFLVPDSELVKPQTGVLASLRDEGFFISPDQNAKTKLIRLLSCLEPTKTLRLAARPGWNDGGVYITPLGEVLGSGAEGWRLSPAPEAQPKCQNKSGTLAGWKAGASAAIASGNRHWALTLCAGFAGVLVQLAGEATCGLNFSGTTTTGKSTAQALQASIWGSVKPGDCTMFTCRSTANAMEAVAAKGNGSTLALDDLQLMPKTEVSELIYALMSESGKSRMSKDGALRDTLSWSTFITLSSEKSIAEMVGTHMGGQAVRCPDIDVSVSAMQVPPAIMTEVNACKSNCGWAGPAFVDHVIKSGLAEVPALVSRRISTATNALVMDGASQQVLRAARIFAILTVAGEIAAEAGLLPNAETLALLIKGAWNAHLTSAEAGALDPAQRAIEKLRYEILTRMETDVATVGVDGDRYRPPVAYMDEQRLYIPVEDLPKLIGDSVKPMAVMKALCEAKHAFKCGDRFCFQAIPGGKKLPHYRFDLKFFVSEAEGGQKSGWKVPRASGETMGLSILCKGVSSKEMGSLNWTWKTVQTLANENVNRADSKTGSTLADANNKSPESRKSRRF